MNEERLQTIVKNKKSDNITYIMSSAFRVKNNHALWYATEYYNQINIVVFRQDEENERNNAFFKEHLASLLDVLSSYSKNVTFVSSPSDLLQYIKGDVIMDKGYLNEEKFAESSVVDYAKEQGVTCHIVESNVLVPVVIASNKEEYSARTIRPKIMKRIPYFMDPVLQDNPISEGEKEAFAVLDEFIENKLTHYDLKNHPELDYTSNLSPYLKYGFISPLTILQEISHIEGEQVESFIEELIVRRELSYNFVYYNTKYDDFYHITYGWAYQTMMAHEHDPKEYIYTKEDYITFSTHDPYFNAAMKEMVNHGKMHGYMRMYWCKKIIEWSNTFEEAYQIAIDLNNYYFLDGNTPNGYTGVAWCFGKHDRAWTERPIFGKLRYMNANGLKRKFDIDAYVEKTNN